MGVRREKKGGGLARETSAPENVGPGCYIPEESAKTSVHTDFPKVSFPKYARPNPNKKCYDHHQTYDTK